MGDLDTDLRNALRPFEPELLVSAAEFLWMRGGDLIVGLLRCPGNLTLQVDELVDKAYGQLDDSGSLKADDLWNVLLVVELEADAPDVEKTIQRLNADMHCSRKLAKRTTEPLPALFLPLGQEPVETSPPVSAGDPIRFALDSTSDGALRQALEVLLKPRRHKEDVDRLIDLLSKDKT
jgi:hypothetical protein